ncbi:hypothetical protein CPB85DRAFT_845862 [Mucidula mucida]|nr:hypothetical protein CPB85DRAFT_845862 [Mucidula mucida]
MARVRVFFFNVPMRVLTDILIVSSELPYLTSRSMLRKCYVYTSSGFMMLSVAREESSTRTTSEWHRSTTRYAVNLDSTPVASPSRSDGWRSFIPSEDRRRAAGSRLLHESFHLFVELPAELNANGHQSSSGERTNDCLLGRFTVTPADHTFFYKKSLRGPSFVQTGACRDLLRRTHVCLSSFFVFRRMATLSFLLVNGECKTSSFAILWISWLFLSRHTSLS